ncbi:hypothetical protein AVEN_4676-1 [Araneus ventricosus]|uniref:Uncharacterized protein n=1 Tax=Araneus ventricosus TaxID=182803 RepID=A0A4Y2LMN9_ARAVE|nr:hypothetical protein AVEN_4676-1 [Araneus ventricosus]
MIRKRKARTPATEENVLRFDAGSSSTQLSAVAQCLGLVCPNPLLLRFCQQTVVIHTMSSMLRDWSTEGVNSGRNCYLVSATDCGRSQFFLLQCCSWMSQVLPKRERPVHITPICKHLESPTYAISCSLK